MDIFPPNMLGKPQPEPVTLYEDADCEVSDRGFARELSLTGRWNPSMLELAHRYKVTRISASQSEGWDQSTLDFLDLIPEIQYLHVITNLSLDWSPVERHSNLEHISLWPDTSVLRPSHPEQGEIDFPKMHRLRSCNIPWIPEWDSIRDCIALQSLTIRDSSKLRILDLSRLHSLTELAMEKLLELREVIVPEEAKLRAIKITQCPKLKIGLKRFVRDIEYLWLGGKLAFPLDELGEANRLKMLWLMFLKNRVELPPLFHRIASLEDLLTVQTRLSKEDQAIERTFIAKRMEKTRTE